MLRSVSWAAFGKAVFFLLVIYYVVVGVLYFREPILGLIRRRGKTLSALLAAMVGLPVLLRAQTADGNNGINQANTLVRSYFDTGTQLMYAVGAIVGLIGAVRVFQLWNGGHREEVGRAAGAWFGSCIFLVLVATVIKSFFGL